MNVVCDDTDVFVLLVHFYSIKCQGVKDVPMFMSSFSKERAIIDIRATAVKHHNIANDLLAIHGLSGSDTVASLHGIGKTTAVKISQTGLFSLSKIGDVDGDMWKSKLPNSHVLHMVKQLKHARL